jgi:hypothetical protein
MFNQLLKLFILLLVIIAKVILLIFIGLTFFIKIFKKN